MVPLLSWQGSCSSFSPATDRKLKIPQLAEHAYSARQFVHCQIYFLIEVHKGLVPGHWLKLQIWALDLEFFLTGGRITVIRFTCFWNQPNVLSDNCPGILTSFDGTNYTLTGVS